MNNDPFDNIVIATTGKCLMLITLNPHLVITLTLPGFTILQSAKPTLHTCQLHVAVLCNHGPLWDSVSSVPGVLCACCGDVQEGRVLREWEGEGRREMRLGRSS